MEENQENKASNIPIMAKKASASKSRIDLTTLKTNSERLKRQSSFNSTEQSTPERGMTYEQ